MEPALKPQAFAAEEFLRPALFDEITEVRIHHPGVIEQEARRRRKRPRLTRDGKLVLVALDHPARAVTRIRGDELAMGDRYQLLARVCRVLADPDLDGFVSTSDVLEELLILSHLERSATGRSFLDGRVLVGTMNRGGLAGTVFEMDDAFTSLTPRRMAQLRCDGGKMLYRLDSEDPASGRTIAACADAVNALRRSKLTAFVEPLSVARKPDGYHSLNDTASLIRNCGVAAALGESSSHVWLKLPYCEDFARVCRATTLPLLLLGGPARENPRDTLADFATGLAAGSKVRGAIIGRNLLFPVGADPLPMCRALTALVHRNAGLDDACRLLDPTFPSDSVLPSKKGKRRR